MKSRNHRKYRPYPPVPLIEREWPARTLTQAPAWCSVDLRDGNQALPAPMDLADKEEFFDLLVRIGFREIEAGFPAASETEYRFLRKLIEAERIPSHVTIQVLTQAREDVIRRTVDSLEGVHRAVIHLYNSTSPAQRSLVFGKTKDEILELAVSGVRWIRGFLREKGMEQIGLEYTPESFTATELEYALEVCEAVVEAWDPAPEEKVIINLPATVEMSTPNVYADRIEWFSKHFRERGRIILSVHTHNDRGTGVAAAELAVLAGAERVEGALFGNGERSGNMDILTMALNLFSQGVDPELDFSSIDEIAGIYRRLTGMSVHERHPYAGELVYTAFSGSHQDAIAKGMRERANDPSGLWNVPYLAIDPADVGRSYEAIIRVNSQSGKGGASHILEKQFGIVLPKWMQKDFGAAVQKAADSTGAELPPSELYGVFRSEYLEGNGRLAIAHCTIDSRADGGVAGQTAQVSAEVKRDGKEMTIKGTGNGPVDAFMTALAAAEGLPAVVEQYAEHSLTAGSDAQAMAYICIRSQDGRSACGAGRATDITLASIHAVLSAWNRLFRS